MCSSELSLVGGFPEIYANINQPSLNTANFNGSWIDSYSPGVTFWVIPFTTDASGPIVFRVDSNYISTPRLRWAGIKTLQLVIHVTWIPAVSSEIVFSSVTSPLVDSTFSSTPTAKLNYIGGVSLFHILSISSSSGSVFLASSDDFDTLEKISITFPSSVSSGVNPCTSQSITSLVASDAVIQSSSALFLTQLGVIKATGSSSNASFIKWTNPLNYCIGSMSVPFVNTGYNASFWAPVFFIGSGSHLGRIWWQRSESYSINEMLDSSNNTVSSSLFNNAAVTIVQATVSKSGPLDVYLLVQTSSTYYIVVYNAVNITWTLQYCFPSTVPAMTETTGATAFQRIWNVSSTGITNAYSGLLSSFTPQNLVLTGISFHYGISSELYVFGNAIFSSSDRATTMLFMRSTGASTFITRFSSSPYSGEYAFETSDYQLWYGQVGATHVAPLIRTRAITALNLPFFDGFRTLKELSLQYNTGTSSATIQMTSLDSSTVVQLSEFVNGFSCPFTYIGYSYSLTTDLQRTWTYPMSFLIGNPFAAYLTTDLDTFRSLPSSLFLDSFDYFTFHVKLRAASGVSLDTLALGFRLSNPSSLMLQTTRSVDDLNGVVSYTATVTDNGYFYSSGTVNVNTLQNTLTVSVANSSLSCSMDNQHLTSSVTLDIDSGCAPFQVFYVHVPESTYRVCNLDPEPVLCVYFYEMFVPSLYIHDLFTGAVDAYTGDYTMKVVGGGATYDSISMYTDTQIAQMNPTESTQADHGFIWRTASTQFYDGFPVMTTSDGVVWFCETGSACAGSVPKYIGDSPSYYLVLEITSNPYPTNTYCIYNTRLTIKLYSIRYSFVASIVTIVVTALIGVASVGGYLFYYTRRRETEFGGFRDEDAYKRKQSNYVAFSTSLTEDPSANISNGDGASVAGSGDGLVDGGDVGQTVNRRKTEVIAEEEEEEEDARQNKSDDDEVDIDDDEKDDDDLPRTPSYGQLLNHKANGKRTSMDLLTK